MRLSLREALLAFRRAPLLSVLGVTTIAFSLFAFGLFSLVAINIRNALRGIEERVEVRAFLVDNAPGDSIAAIMEELGKREDSDARGVRRPRAGAGARARGTR